MYRIMFALTLMDFTVLESTGNGRKFHTNNKNHITFVCFIRKQKAFRKETREKHGLTSIPFFTSKRFPGYIFFRNICNYT